MPVKLPLTPDEQMGLLAEAVQPHSEFAQKFYRNLPLKTHGLVPWDERGVARQGGKCIHKHLF